MAANERVQFIPQSDVQSDLSEDHTQTSRGGDGFSHHDKGSATSNDSKHIHWRVPSLMATGLGVGIIFALVHHLFNHYWNQKVVSDSTQQQWVVRGGTAFAFAVKTAFAVATGTAYVQVLWLRLRSKCSPIGKVDSMFGILGNAWEFHDLKLWLGAPALLTLAIITWSMPLIAIITPGTITTITSMSKYSHMIPVPQFDFSTDKKFGTGASDCGMWKPTNELGQLTRAVAYGGSILPAAPPAVNCSYDLSNFAPHLACTRADAAALESFKNVASDWTIKNRGKLEYLAWTSGPGDMDGLYKPVIDDLPASLLSTATQDPSELFIYAQLGEGNDETAANYNSEGPISNPLSVLISCKLQNASYDLSFAFNNNIQDLTVHNINPTPDTFENTVDEGNEIAMPKWSYISAMMSYIGILIGQVATSIHDGSQQINGTTILSTNLGKYLYSQGSSDPSNKTYTELPDIFQAGLEELFSNMTLSLLSSPTYLMSGSSVPEVNVTASSPIQIYIYQPADLYIAYGVGLLCTLLCLALGAYAIRKNQSTFSNNFSSILRSTRNPELNTIIRADELSRSDPLPKHTAKSTIKYHTLRDGVAGFELVQD